MRSRIVPAVPIPVEITNGTAWWQVAAAVGSAVGGVAAAFAAGASWRSASASQAASRTALEALAIGIRPQLQVTTAVDTSDGTPGRVSLMITNRSQWPAADAEVEVRYRDGSVDHARRDRLLLLGTEGHWIVPLTRVTPGVSQREDGQDMYGDARVAIESVVVTYRDERKIQQYRLRLSPAPLAGAMPFSTFDVEPDTIG